MTASATQWANDLASWGIPSEILEQAPTSPWIHPPALFFVPKEIPSTISHELAREALGDGGSILDVGCGGGIAAFAATPPATHVIGVDHQQEMLEMFGNEADSRGVTHEEFFGDWPDVAGDVPVADVATCHHVVYNVSDIVPFINVLDAHARKRVIIEIPQHHPLAMMTAAWKHFWNLDRPTNPTSGDLLTIVRDLGFDAQMSNWESPLGREIPFEQQVEFMRIRLCLPESRDGDIAEFLKSQPGTRTRILSTIWWDK
jgi:SAM-dependent methyltransferase